MPAVPDREEDRIMQTRTLSDVLNPFDIAVADQALADIEVPVLAVPQAQGDVYILPVADLFAAERRFIAAVDVHAHPGAVSVPPEGVAVVRGEATGNTHLLTAADGEVRWVPLSSTAHSVLLGVVEVAPGAVAYLIHTDEHGANGIAPGTYALHGKREQRDVISRVAD